MVLGSWSLCTEEQFYIIAPLALFFLARYLGGVRKFQPWLWGLLLSIPLLRMAVWVHETGHFFQHSPGLFVPLYYNFHTHCDGLIMGLIISNLWITHEVPIRRVASPGVLIVVAIALLAGLHLLQKEIFDFTGLALFFGSFVWLGLQRPLALFNSRLFYWLSRLSFGMYLNHAYMCPWIVRAFLPRLPFSAHFLVLTNLIGVVVITMLSAAIALVTFCCVEYPFLQLRKTVLERHSKRLVSASQPKSVGRVLI